MQHYTYMYMWLNTRERENIAQVEQPKIFMFERVVRFFIRFDYQLRSLNREQVFFTVCKERREEARLYT